MSHTQSVPTLMVLAVPDCPNAPLLLARLRRVLAARPALTPTYRTIHNEHEAERYGMHGSPTLLINGVDPFAPPDQPTTLSCRLFHHPDGHIDGVPTLADLAAVLLPHDQGPVP
ncbi:hypothetical protein [Nocardia terpenica]|uniref:Alkylmercury lyase n=1 Tax=Nocardia terpenica TaxID=455432 RepID=A0A6G9YXY5_9NOCA|nr:hypothetical protein [Nocardia terpenica]QIS18185.1 hypothetical protein F6W96_07600 [Nocardia terpenica]